MPILDITFFSPLPFALTKFLIASGHRRPRAGNPAGEQRFEGKIGVHGLCAVAPEQREVVHFAC